MSQNFCSVIYNLSFFLVGKIQILKCQGVKSKHSKTSEGKIQILKLWDVKSKHSKTLVV